MKRRPQKNAMSKPSVKPVKLKELAVRNGPKGGQRSGCNEFDSGMNHNELVVVEALRTKAASARKAKPKKSASKVKDLPPRKDPRGGGSVDKIAINHNEVMVADGAWIG